MFSRPPMLNQPTFLYVPTEEYLRILKDRSEATAALNREKIKAIDLMEELARIRARDPSLERHEADMQSLRDELAHAKEELLDVQRKCKGLERKCRQLQQNCDMNAIVQATLMNTIEGQKKELDKKMPGGAKLSWMNNGGGQETEKQTDAKPASLAL